MVGRHQGHGVDGAPIVVHLDWGEKSLPSAEVIASGALVPHRTFSPDFLAGFGMNVDTADLPCAGFALVHDQDDAADASSLRRIGNFGLKYHPDIHRFPFASVPMAVRRIERDRVRAGKAEPGPSSGRA
jgi:hypothetical protein